MATTSTDSDDTLAAAATSPKRVVSDNTSAEAHSLSDQIELDKYRNNKASRGNPAAMLTPVKLVPPGTT
jgi:hypothetical protein